MGTASQSAATSDACLIAAEQVQRKLMAIARKINILEDATVRPNNPLPVDVFLDHMGAKKSAPRIVFEPKRLGDQIWTESVTAFLYAGIERAFWKAGKMPGGDRPGYRRKLTELRHWVEKQGLDLDRVVPIHFVPKTTFLFSEGMLAERRRDRIRVISNIGYHSPSKASDLAQLKAWIVDDLANSCFQKKGRSTGHQKIIFATEIANVWAALTGAPITKKPDGNFGQFLTACWKSGFVDVNVSTCFRRTLHDHFAEIKGSKAPTGRINPNLCEM